MSPAGAAGVEQMAFVLDAMIMAMVTGVAVMSGTVAAAFSTHWCARRVARWRRSRREAASVHAEAMRGLHELECYLHQDENSS